MNDALGQFLRIFRDIGFAVARQGVIQERGQAPRLAYAMRHLALNSDALEIARGFLENKRRISARHRDGDQGSRGRVVEERKSHTFARNPAVAILQKVSGGLRFDEFNSEHKKAISVSIDLVHNSKLIPR